MAVTVIGLGTMGLPIAKRLLGAGYDVVGFDVRDDARARFAQCDGARVADTALEAVADAETVVLMLMSSQVVESVVLSGGVLDALREGSLLLDMGSSSALSTRRLAELARERGVAYVDAPVSGGGHWSAAEGTMTIIVGGSDTDVARCMSLLQQLGTTIRHVGPAGAGHALKAINNLLSAVTLLASSEALVLGRRFGLDPARMMEVINASSGQSDSTTRKIPRFVITESYDSGGPLRGMLKDVRNATDLAAELGADLRLGGAVADLWQAAARDLPPEADYTEIARWVSGEFAES
ncbi:MAG: NAD(P)-dependent oxidoreductase [Solirubrobacteraceae bacterium]